jgi:hypothetical protein
MAGKTERTRVEINESTTDGLRTFNITLTAPASDFALTDLLKQRNVIEGLDADLKLAVKGATERYLNDAESLIAKLATESTPGHKARTKGKQNGKVDNDQRPNQMTASN